MNRSIRCGAMFAFVTLNAGLTSRAAQSSPEPSRKQLLHENWAIQSSCETHAAGEEISKAGFRPEGWHRTGVPSTVVAALVTDKTYPDPNFGMNIRKFPGVKYAVGDMFANLEIPEDSPFHCSWWYRTEFSLAPGARSKTRWLHFEGINYRANIWVNGQKIAGETDVIGTFRTFEFDVTRILHAGRNGIAVEVFAPRKNDLAITWVDWNPTPPDKNMGLWKDVYLTTAGGVTLRRPFVNSKLGPDFKSAALTITAEVRNVSSHPVKGVFHARIEGIDIRQPVELSASETKVVRLSPEQFPRLKLANPRLWWPYQMGKPNLYAARLAFEIGGQASDTAQVTFGIRQVTSELTKTGGRLFRINGKNLLIRGGGWSSDMLLRWSPKRLTSELRLTRDMGLNTIRLEGKLERNEFFDLADHMGLLIMPGWCCCDMWEHWQSWEPEHYKIAAASLADQLYRLRNHPSVFVWLYGSDGPPPADIEKMYLQIFKDKEWPNPSVSSATDTPTTVTGPSGMKMTGPYEYVPPSYWLTDKEAGGAFGHNSETSPGPAIPPLESLKRFIPADHLWPIDDVWNFHAGGERFMTVNVFTNAMNKRYGEAPNLEDYLRKAQAMTYEGQRAMFEAYARNKYNSTGVIQWMLNNAWPSLIWHLYDYYLVPAGGYFGTKKACETLHVQYSHDDNSVAVINGTYIAQQGMTVSAKLYGLEATVKASRDATLDLAPDSSTKAFDLPTPDNLTRTYFLRLQLHDATGKRVSDNFYWLSTKSDEMDWAKRKDTVYTPQSDFADLTDLNTLPKVSLKVRQETAKLADGGKTRVFIENPSKNLAFMVHLRLTRGKGGEDVLPIFWDDNYFSLLPGEKREVTAHYDLPSLGKKSTVLEIDGWNITPQTLAGK